MRQSLPTLPAAGKSVSTSCASLVWPEYQSIHRCSLSPKKHLTCTASYHHCSAADLASLYKHRIGLRPEHATN